MSGSGLPAVTHPIPAMHRQQAPSANTTANSCATRWCFAVVPASVIGRIYAPPIAIFSIPLTAGNFPGCVWHDPDNRPSVHKQTSTMTSRQVEDLEIEGKHHGYSTHLH